MACSPATPAPTTSTRAGVMVPAAVMSIGNMRGSSDADSSTALYPATVAIADSTSMLCARVMRGISSTAKALTPVAAISCTVRGEARGRRKPMSVCPGRSSGRSAAPVRSLAP
jgi:hypothetical protein